MRRTWVTFKNYDFPTEGTDEYPPGLEAAEFFVEALNHSDVNAKYADIFDFYAHELDCRVGRRRFSLMVGFGGEVDELLIFIDASLPRFLRFFGIHDNVEFALLQQTLHGILEDHGFEDVRWWTQKEWAGARQDWSAVPEGEE